MFFWQDDEGDSGTKDEQLEHEDDITEDIVDEGNVSGSDEGRYLLFNDLYTYLISRDILVLN